MFYSRWDPTTGEYDYFEGATLAGLNDDLPVPSLPAGTDIGVASVECGRPLPSGAVPVGSGELARGVIVPSAGASTPIGQIFASRPWLLPAALGAAVGALATWLWGRR